MAPLSSMVENDDGVKYVLFPSFKYKGGGRKQNKWRDRKISAQNDKRGGCNKRGGWQKSPKIINKEAGINGEAGKNIAIRNFIEIKSSNGLVKISATKKHKEYKGSLEW